MWRGSFERNPGPKVADVGVGVPTGTCVEIIESLNRKINAALADPACCHFPEAAVRLG